MRSRKKLVLILLLALTVLCLSSCQESNESKYKSAQDLLSKGQYEEAIKKFEELAEFEQAASYLAYCKAIQAGTSGNFKDAVSQFEALADFEESVQYKTYYQTRISEDEIGAKGAEAWEDKLAVATAYESIGEFQDSKERADKLRQEVHDLAVNDATELDYEAAITKLTALGEFGDSKSLIDHYNDVQTKEYNVSGLHWERKIQIEENVAYGESGWELPEGAELAEQKEEIHHYESTVDHYEPASIVRSQKVVDHYDKYPTYGDKGNGIFGEIVFSKPVYEMKDYIDTIAAPIYSQSPVYQTKYYYNLRHWVQTREVESSGDDHSAAWPETNLSEYEREGEKTDFYTFTITTDAEGNTRTFVVSEDIWNGIEADGKVYLTVIKSQNTEFLSDKAGEKKADLVESN